MKKVIYKLFHPPKYLAIPLCIISTILLIVVFSKHLEETTISYISYFLSSYSLIIFIIWFIKACEFSSNFVKNNSKIYHWYDKNKEVITHHSLHISFYINLIYGLFKLLTGIYFKSAWFITFAIYYLLLCLMKRSLITSYKKDNVININKKIKHIGIILLFLDIVLSGMIILIIHKNETFIYPGYLIYIVALYDFYLVISASINVIKQRKQNNPLIFASRGINLTVAMISMISLEVAMIYQFGNNDIEFKNTMIGITGFVVALINSIMSMIMIYKGAKYPNKINLNI